jgi:hypothetical protein
MTRIVTTTHRYKRPAKKRKAVAIAGPAIVKRQTLALKVLPSPANDDAPARPAPAAAKSAIATSISRKRARLLSAEQAAEPDDDPEATARVKAFFARMMRPPGQ